MARDVDLSSQSWNDIIFEGKNKEFGAYQMRKKSENRHTKAMIIVACIASLIIAVAIFFASDFYQALVASSEAENIQEQVDFEEMPEEVEEEQEEIELPEELPPPEEQIEKEDVANEQQVTEPEIVKKEDFDETKTVKDKSEIQENAAQLGDANVKDGSDDLNKDEVQDKIIVEKKVEVVVQEKEKEEDKKEEKTVEKKEYNFNDVQVKPEFPGGEAELHKWLASHVDYPTMAAEEGIEGRVMVKFLVTEDGSVSNVQIHRGKHPLLDKEALRVVKSLPKFKPGNNNGHPVRVWYAVPINFKLSK